MQGGSFAAFGSYAFDARRLSEQVRSARTWEERGLLLDDFLLDRATRGPQPSPEASHAWHLLVRSSGTTTIPHLDDEQSWARIAAECGYADQAHLTREFRRFTGTTPGALITA